MGWSEGIVLKVGVVGMLWRELRFEELFGDFSEVVLVLFLFSKGGRNASRRHRYCHRPY
jgi:hypothetical protein